VFENEELQLPKIVQEVTQMFNASAQLKSVELKCEIDPTTPQFLRGDPNRIR
jgi:signal transduction histidine kinase